VSFSNRPARRPERGSKLGAEKLRLFPRREVIAFVELVVLDELWYARSVQLCGAS
jgi:hypothetical protein